MDRPGVLLSACAPFIEGRLFLAAFAGGALWRIVGVLIVVPVLAVCIIVFGRIPSMRPVAVLPSSDGRVEPC